MIAIMYHLNNSSMLIQETLRKKVNYGEYSYGLTQFICKGLVIHISWIDDDNSYYLLSLFMPNLTC